MGVQLDTELINAYAEAFKKRERLMQAWIEHALCLLVQVGFQFVTNSSGRVFSKKKVGMKDIEANRDLIEAVVEVSKGSGRYSTCVLAKAILQHYTVASVLSIRPHQ